MKIFIKLYDEILQKEASRKGKESAGYLARAMFICTLISMDAMLDNKPYTDAYFQKRTCLDTNTIQRCKRYFEGLGLIKTESTRKGTKYTLQKGKIDGYYGKPYEQESFFRAPSVLQEDGIMYGYPLKIA